MEQNKTVKIFLIDFSPNDYGVYGNMERMRTNSSDIANGPGPFMTQRWWPNVFARNSMCTRGE
jgi:hypothetical protein